MNCTDTVTFFQGETCFTEVYILVDGGLSYDDLWATFFFTDASLLLMMLLFQ